MKKYKLLHAYQQWSDRVRAYMFVVGEIAVPVEQWAIDVLGEFFEEVQ